MIFFMAVFEFNTEDVTRTLEESGRELGDFDGFLSRIDDLKHSYDKFRFSGDVYKPPFETIYESVKEYVKPLIPDAAKSRFATALDSKLQVNFI